MGVKCLLYILYCFILLVNHSESVVILSHFDYQVGRSLSRLALNLGQVGVRISSSKSNLESMAPKKKQKCADPDAKSNAKEKAKAKAKARGKAKAKATSVEGECDLGSFTENMDENHSLLANVEILETIAELWC